MTRKYSVYRMMFYAFLLLAIVNMRTIHAQCVDTEPFKFQGEDTMCAGADCNKNKVKTNCPLTCGECTPDAISSDCADIQPFMFQGEDTMCAGADCSKNKVKTNCPLTCGECTPDVISSDCADIQPFKFQGEDTMCAGADCNKNKVKTNCPLTCGECTPDGSGSGSGSGSGTGGGSGSSSCVDLKKKFKASGQNGKKKCNMWKDLCGENNKVDNNCPKTCGTCGPPTNPPTTPCLDVSGKFNFKNGKKSCKQVGKKQNKHCKREEAKENCPVTCDLCPSDNKTPTASPSESPSVEPSASPSNAPSSSPTAAPSTSPSNAPTKAECTLAGRIEFTGSTILGYHSSSLRVARNNWNAICSRQKKTTGWGCVHEGEAKIGQWNDDTIGCNEVESATIEYAAGGVYNFTMQHVFDYLETYYESDHTIRPALTISVNGIDIDTYRYPANTNTDTHIDGLPNGAYKGIVNANVECDADCNCGVARVVPTCPIRAEIQFPTLSEAYETNITGYQNDAISVFQEGVQESCSSADRIRKWCVHEGDGEFYSSYPSDYYHDISSTESIVITEALDGNFMFEIKSDMTDTEEYYYGGDENLSGTVQLWIDNKDKGVYTHLFNNNYEDTFYLDVRCDDDCKCEVQQVDHPVCKIEAKVKFPNKENMDYYGYKNDYVIAQKSGELETCEWETPGATGWNCLHDGGDAYVWYGKDGSFEKDTESVIINGAADGDFRFTLQHWASDMDLYYDNDHKISSSMSISINEEEQVSKFSYPQTLDTDNHHADGSINTDYPGTVYVDVSCDTLCNCEMIERVPTCELNAELSFPDFTSDYYGYNAEVASVIKEGEEEECGYYSAMTSWGCFSSGDAYITESTDESYYSHKSSQLINIPDASNSVFYFTVEYFNAEFDPDYYNSIKHKSMLDITVNGGAEGTFKHKRNSDEETHNADGTVNENYTSQIVVKVSCDMACSCEAEKQLENM